MVGKVTSGSFVTLDPVEVKNLAVGDIVLCRVKGITCLHLVKEGSTGLPARKAKTPRKTGLTSPEWPFRFRASRQIRPVEGD